MKPTLNNIHHFLSQEGMQGVIEPASDEFPIEQLYVGLGVDEKQRDLILQIKITAQDLDADHDVQEKNQNQKVNKSEHFHLQMMMALPFHTKPKMEGEIARLILLINKTMAIPGFEFSEVDHLVYFRSVQLIKDDLDELVLIALIGNVVAQVENFSETFEAFKKD